MCQEHKQGLGQGQSLGLDLTQKPTLSIDTEDPLECQGLEQAVEATVNKILEECEGDYVKAAKEVNEIRLDKNTSAELANALKHAAIWILGPELEKQGLVL